MKNRIVIIFIIVCNLSFSQVESLIKYYNTMMTLSNYYYSDLDISDKHYQNTNESLVSYKKYNGGVVSYLNHPYSYSANESVLKQLEAEVLSPPDTLENKEVIVTHLKAAILSMNKNRDLCVVVSKYIDDKSYTADTGLKKFYSYTKTFQINAASVYENFREALSLASEQIFKIESEALKEAAFSAWIIPMKEDLKEADLIFNCFKNKNKKRLESSIKKIKTAMESHRTTEGKPIDQLTDIYYKSVYKDFYQKLDEFLRLVNNENTDIEWISDKYTEAIEKYNLFVSEYNLISIKKAYH